MFFSIKAKTLIYTFSLLLGISIAAISLSFIEIKKGSDEVFPVFSSKELKILIDAGHGGFDGGATVNGVSEKDINLSVALKLKDLIKENGWKVEMTRDSDTSTEDKERKDGTSAKTSDLKRRREMIKEKGADLFISIHMNKFPQEKYWGAQVFYASSPPESRILGECIQKALPRLLEDGNERVAKQGDSGIYILKSAEVPSVIVECGFLSNPQEVIKLQDDEHQNKLALAIYEGIKDFVENYSIDSKNPSIADSAVSSSAPLIVTVISSPFAAPKLISENKRVASAVLPFAETVIDDLNF